MARFETERIEFPNFIACCSSPGCDAHFHPSIEVMYLERGNYCAEIDNKKYSFSQGDILVALPFQLHGFYQTDYTNKEVILVIDESFFPEYEDRFNNFSFVNPVLSKDQIPKELVDLIYMAASATINSKDNDGRLLYRFLCGAVLWHLFRLMPMESNRKGNIGHIQKIVKYIYENYDNEALSLEKIAAHFGYNKTYLSSIINKTFHRNFKSVLNMLRLNEAKKQLAYSDENVSEIAFRCGFNSIRTFNSAFYYLEKLSPTAYRKAQRQAGRK